MIEQLKHIQTTNESLGGKINGLVQLQQLGFRVPNGMVIDALEVTTWWLSYFPEWNDVAALRQLRDETIRARIDQLVLPETLINSLKNYIKVGQTYIVRSSGLLEDQAQTSLAGFFDSTLNCQSLNAIIAGIKRSLASLFKKDVLQYWQEQQLPLNQLRMALIIQEQIPASLAGVAFSMDPVTNDDQAIVVEYTQGSNEQLVQGQITPVQVRLPWKRAAEYVMADLSLKESKALVDAVLNLSRHFGFPLDIEFAFYEQQLYLLQVRPITYIPAITTQGSWTTANFRDGGVAAQVIPHLMGSLYHASWQKALSQFLIDNNLYEADQIPHLMIEKYARPYWNIGIVKTVMQKIPGFIEREFDEELGVQNNYSGDGRKSRLSLSSLLYTLKVAFKLNQTTKLHQASSQKIHTALLDNYERLNQAILSLSAQSPRQAIELLWIMIIEDAYMEAETNYFKQVYINTVQLSMKKTALLNILTQEQLFQLLAHIGNISHLKPRQALIDIVVLIKKDPDIHDLWKENKAAFLEEWIKQHPQHPIVKAILNFQTEFGYHSQRELNLLEPSYSESLATIVDMLQWYLLQKEAFEELEALTLDDIKQLVSKMVKPNQVNKVVKQVVYLRNLMWWREEFKDISTRYYHLIRQITLKLGERYQQLGFIAESHHLFYATKEMIMAFIKEECSLMQLQEEIQQNQQYTQAYRNYNPPGDLFESIQSEKRTDGLARLKGLGASNGIVTGVVRVLSDLNDIHHLQAGEILVTTFTDTGWSYAFSRIAGLITETGGVLCHASIVAREFDLPAIVAAQGATTQLKTGMTISMDGHTGEIIIQESR